MNLDPHVPPIELPFPHRLNPHTEALADSLWRWVRGTGALAPTTEATWSAIRYDWLMGCMYPTAPLRSLEAIGQVVLWLFLYDDHLDPGGAADDPRRALDLAHGVARLLRETSAPRPDDPVLVLLWRWCADFQGKALGGWWRRCAVDLAQCATGIAQEVAMRSAGVVPDARTYLTHRRVTVGWGLLTDLIEFADGAELPDRVRRPADFQRLRWSAGDITCAINDLLSLGKELRAGESHNLVLVLHRTEGCDLPTAVDRVHRWLTRRLGDYLSLRDRLRRTCPPADRVALDRYAEGLECLMRGVVDWCSESGRYRRALAFPGGGDLPS